MLCLCAGTGLNVFSRSHGGLCDVRFQRGGVVGSQWHVISGRGGKRNRVIENGVVFESLVFGRVQGV